MTPKQQEILESIRTANSVHQATFQGKEITYYTYTANLEEIAKYIYSLESRLDDLYKILSQRIEIGEK